MLVCASIITQPIEAQANKNSRKRIMQANYAGFARSVVAVADFFTRQRAPIPGMIGSFPLGPTVRVRLARLAGE